jgi:hypothetical protein
VKRHVHPHREVVALNVRRADVVQVGATRDFLFDRTNASCGAISILPLRVRAVNLLQHGVANVAIKHGVHCGQVRLVAVALVSCPRLASRYWLIRYCARSNIDDQLGGLGKVSEALAGGHFA